VFFETSSKCLQSFLLPFSCWSTSKKENNPEGRTNSIERNFSLLLRLGIFTLLFSKIIVYFCIIILILFFRFSSFSSKYFLTKIKLKRKDYRWLRKQKSNKIKSKRTKFRFKSFQNKLINIRFFSSNTFIIFNCFILLRLQNDIECWNKNLNQSWIHKERIRDSILEYFLGFNTFQNHFLFAFTFIQILKWRNKKTQDLNLWKLEIQKKKEHFPRVWIMFLNRWRTEFKNWIYIRMKKKKKNYSVDSANQNGVNNFLTNQRWVG